METRFDQFTKGMAGGFSRRNALRWLGGIWPGTFLAAWSGQKKLSGAPSSNGNDISNCHTFCANVLPQQRAQCENYCIQCNGNAQDLCGAAGAFVCCPSGTVCCCDTAACCTTPCAIAALQQTNLSFNAPTVVPLGVSTTWTLSFKLTPMRVWVKVWMSGGKLSQEVANGVTK